MGGLDFIKAVVANNVVKADSLTNLYIWEVYDVIHGTQVNPLFKALGSLTGGPRANKILLGYVVQPEFKEAHTKPFILDGVELNMWNDKSLLEWVKGLKDVNIADMVADVTCYMEHHKVVSRSVYEGVLQEARNRHRSLRLDNSRLKYCLKGTQSDIDAFLIAIGDAEPYNYLHKHQYLCVLERLHTLDSLETMGKGLKPFDMEAIMSYAKTVFESVYEGDKDPQYFLNAVSISLLNSHTGKTHVTREAIRACVMGCLNDNYRRLRD